MISPLLETETTEDALLFQLTVPLAPLRRSLRLFPTVSFAVFLLIFTCSSEGFGADGDSAEDPPDDGASVVGASVSEVSGFFLHLAVREKSS